MCSDKMLLVFLRMRKSTQEANAAGISIYVSPGLHHEPGRWTSSSKLFQIASQHLG